MRISIEFDSCWQTSFLGDDEKKPLHKIKAGTNKPASEGYMQKFVATTQTRGEKTTVITKDTVLGVLCRLIGDQRKLYQARSSENYYFSEIEEKISFSIAHIENTTQELMYLTNKSDDRCAQSSSLGVLSSDNPWFFSDVASKLWSVLYLDKQALLDFILNNEVEDSEVNCSPKNLFARIDDISNTKLDEGSVLMTKKRLLFDKTKEIEKKEKHLKTALEKAKDRPPESQSQISRHEWTINKINDEILQLKNELSKINTDTQIDELDNKIAAVVAQLTKKFPECKYWDNDSVHPKRLYASAIYLQAERLINTGVNIDFAIVDKGKYKGEIAIKGVSKNSNANPDISPDPENSSNSQINFGKPIMLRNRWIKMAINN